MSKKYLVPLDGSETSLKASATALEMAQPGDSVMLFSVITQIPDYSIYGFAPDVAAAKEMMQNRKSLIEKEAGMKKAMLDQEAEKFRAKGIETSVETRTGFPPDEIVSLAEEGAYDLIVMGSRGLSPTKRFFLGSVSERVLFRAKCNVLIVK